jgi:aspartyl-tRNA(Asn)/glutamyl-tRNA(Gln) amidotransferase subunit A
VDAPGTITEASEALARGSIGAVELVTALLDRADAHDAVLGAYVTRLDEHALAAARDADDRRRRGEGGALLGIPLGVKDILAARECATRAQSVTMPPDWWAGRDATSVARLREAGAVVLGKLSTSEYAIGYPDPAKPFPIPRNPWDTGRWAGGSSSGTAVAVASGLVLGGLGTDTGGSVRIPAAMCGITGLKPTFGLVPTTGCVPLGFTFDHVGPMARTASDCALLLDVLRGPDVLDPHRAARAIAPTAPQLTGHLRDVRIGVFRSHHDTAVPVHAEIDGAFDAAIAVLTDAGATIRDVTVPHFAALTDAALVGVLCEGFAYHRVRLSQRWFDYSAATRLALATGALYEGADYVNAQRVRHIAAVAFDALLRDVDLVVLPTSYMTAPLLGASRGGAPAPFTSKASALPTPAFNALGVPALSTGMGFSADGLPLALQIVGRRYDDALVLRAADAYQRRTDWHRRTAPVPAPPADPSVAPAPPPGGSADPVDWSAVAGTLRRAGIPADEVEVETLAIGFPIVREVAAGLHRLVDGADVTPLFDPGRLDRT